MDRRRAGNPGRRGYVIDTPTPRGRTINELDSLAPAVNESRGTGLRNARMNPEDEERKPRYMPELDRRELWPERPGKGTIRRLKKGGTVNAAGNYTKPDMRKKLVAEVKASGKGGKPGQWSARKAQMVAKKYKAKGGGYK